MRDVYQNTYFDTPATPCFKSCVRKISFDTAQDTPPLSRQPVARSVPPKAKMTPKAKLAPIEQDTTGVMLRERQDWKEARNAIMRFLRKGPATLAQIRKTCPASAHQAQRIVAYLTKTGRLRRGDGHLYEVIA